MNLSVVIATLGRPELIETIEALYNNSIQPVEVLVCIPKSIELPAGIEIFEGVRVVRTDKGGQVYQRSIGFKAAKCELIMQLDDDVIMECRAIETLLTSFSTIEQKRAIAPTFYWSGTNKRTYDGKHTGFWRKIIDWVANGKDGRLPGIVSLSGLNFGLCFDDEKEKIHRSQWLSGGCVLHHVNDLVTFDYFPYVGKAYAEDVMHSFLLKEKGVDLFVCRDATAYIKEDPYSLSFREFYRQYRAAEYAAKLWNKNLLRLKIYYITKFCFFNIIKLLGK